MSDEPWTMTETEPTISEPVAEPSARVEVVRERRRLHRLRLILPVLVLLAFLSWAYTTNYIPSRSMEPTLRPGDHILTMRTWLAYPGNRIPSRGDIITFIPPEEALQGDGPPAGPRAHNEVWIKRVIGLPGESVWIVRGQVLINGAPLPSGFYTGRQSIFHNRYPFASFAPLLLADDEVFVLGDNPNDSDDSRNWGPLKRSQIIGKYIRVLFNEGHFGLNQHRDQTEGRS